MALLGGDEEEEAWAIWHQEMRARRREKLLAAKREEKE